MDDTERALLARIVEAFADAPEDKNAPQYRNVQLRLTVPEVIALRKLRASFYASAKKEVLTPKHACL